MAKIFTAKTELYHAVCVPSEEKGDLVLVEASAEQFEDDDVCAECGDPIKEEPEPSQSDQRAADGPTQAP